MFKTILVPTDGSARSEKAVKAAIEFAQQVDGKLIGISVVEPYPFPPLSESPYIGGSEAYERRALELAKEHVAAIASAAAAARIPCETIVVHSLNPHEEIVNAAERLRADVIFMASHGRKGLNKFFAGSETQKVIANASVPVTVFR